jgi:hypothetical protein
MDSYRLDNTTARGGDGLLKYSRSNRNSAARHQYRYEPANAGSARIAVRESGGFPAIAPTRSEGRRGRLGVCCARRERSRGLADPDCLAGQRGVGSARSHVLSGGRCHFGGRDARFCGVRAAARHHGSRRSREDRNGLAGRLARRCRTGGERRLPGNFDLAGTDSLVWGFGQCRRQRPTSSDLPVGARCEGSIKVGPHSLTTDCSDGSCASRIRVQSGRI